MSPVSKRYDVACMPQGIQPRKLEQYSIHHNTLTRLWIVTMARWERTEPRGLNLKKTMSFKFSNENEAKKFAKACAPPKMLTATDACQICSSTFTARVRPCWCRNCGHPICDKCSTRWAIRMFPITHVSQQSLTARVCTSCDWIKNAFCIILLTGGLLQDAKTLFDTGNLNLRTWFAEINNESMLPVHCAVMGGNLHLLRWLVETHACPIAVKRDNRNGRMLSLQTSANKSLIDLAMTGKPKLDILKYLIVDHNMSLQDSTNPNLAPRTLEALLRAGITLQSTPEAEVDKLPHEIHSVADDSVTMDDNACNLCYDQPMDCVVTPCGHQLCCSDCGIKLETCPLCKIPCKILKVFRQ